MHPPSVPLDSSSVKLSKTFFSLARHLKLTLSMNIGLHWNTYQLRRTRSHSSGIDHQPSTRLYSVASNLTLRPVVWQHYYGNPKSQRRLDYCLPNCQGWDSIGRRNPADRHCSSGLPQRLPCTPVSMWRYCPIRRPLSCRFNAGQFPRHAAINSIIKRSLDAAGLHSILEPVGLDRGNSRGPDEVTSFPF